MPLKTKNQSIGQIKKKDQTEVQDDNLDDHHRNYNEDTCKYQKFHYNPSNSCWDVSQNHKHEPEWDESTMSKSIQ